MTSFNRTAIAAFVWTLTSVAGSHVIRMASNLILTRLLFPEMFGVMAVINAVVTGIAMFSDIGLRECVLHGGRASQSSFLNTAWSVQVIRGVAIYLVIALAALPLQNFYGIDGFAQILCVASLTSIISSLLPMRVILQEKQLLLKRIAILGLLAQLIGAVAMIVIAYFTRSIWSLVIGVLLGSMSKLLLMYLYIPGPKDKFEFEWRALSEIWRFGRWIFLSTASLFLASQGDRLILGAILTPAVLGIYSLAIMFSMLISDTAEVLAVRYLSPFYRKLKDSEKPFYSVVRRVRRWGLMAAFAVCFVLSQIGDWVIWLLYDERYQAAGGLLQVMAFGAFYRTMDATLRPLFFVFYDSLRSMIYQAIKGVIYVGSLVAGWYFAGGEGLLASIALAPLLAYFLLLLLLGKHGYKAWFEEGVIILATSVAFIVAWYWFDTFPLHAAKFLST